MIIAIHLVNDDLQSWFQLGQIEIRSRTWIRCFKVYNRTRTNRLKVFQIIY